MGGGRFDDRVRDLLVDAAACADAQDWPGARDLARAALALDPGSAEAQRLLERADGAAAGRRGAAPADRDVLRRRRLHGAEPAARPRARAGGAPQLPGHVRRGVRRYEGRIARYIGDGILAYFGHPVAHEDDARRGVTAGLDLIEAPAPVTVEMRPAVRRGAQCPHRRPHRARRAGRHGVSGDPRSRCHRGRDAEPGRRLQDHARRAASWSARRPMSWCEGGSWSAPWARWRSAASTDPVPTFEVVEEAGTESRVQAQVDLSPFVGRRGPAGGAGEAWEEVEAGGSRTWSSPARPASGSRGWRTCCAGASRPETGQR